MFSLLQDDISPPVVKKVLEKQHGASDKICTTIVHPTPVTLNALDIIFELEPGKWSSGANSLCREMRRLKDMSMVYGLLDMVYTTHRFGGLRDILPHDNTGGLLDSDLSSVCNSIIESLDDANAINRLTEVSQHFHNILRTYIALGVVPVLSKSEQYSYSVSDFIREDASWSTLFFDAYLSIVEHSVNALQLVEYPRLRNTVLITSQADTYSCTDYGDTRYNLCTFGLLKSGVSPIAPLIYGELQVLFATEEAKRFVLERLTKTNLIVSTEPSSELAAIIKHNEQAGSKAHSELQSVQEEIKKINGMSDTKAKPCEAGGAELRQVNAELLNSEAKHLELIHVTAERIENGIGRYNLQEVAPHQSHDSDRPYMTPIAPSFPLNQITPRIEKQVNQMNVRAIQDQNLTQELKEKTIELEKKNKSLYVTQTELVDLFIKNERLQMLVKTFKSQETLLANRLKLSDRNLEEMRRDNEKLRQNSDHMKQALSKIGAELHLRDEEVQRLASVFATGHESGLSHSTESDSGPMDTSDETVSFIYSVVRRALSAFGADNKYERSEETSKSKPNPCDARTRLAFERMLTSCNAIPTPLYPHHVSRQNLHLTNQCVPDSFHDAIVCTGSETRKVDMMKKHGQAVIETDNLTMVDINPKSGEDVRMTRKMLANNRVISEDDSSLLTDNLFQYKYLNVQFKSKTDLDTIYKPLGEKWAQVTKSTLMMEEQSYTYSGQTLPPRVGCDAIVKYIEPFYCEMGGRRAHAYKLPAQVVEMERMVGETGNETGQNTSPATDSVSGGHKYHTIIKSFLSSVLCIREGEETREANK